MTIVTPYLTFPGISWWARVAKADVLLLDGSEHFRKMTQRNRYRIAGANNPIMLSVPLVNGRHQHEPMSGVQIFNGERWQVQHWRTLVSVYRSAPFFEHYEESLSHLFEEKYDYLIDFNIDTLLWVKKQLRLSFELQKAAEFVPAYPTEVEDLRYLKEYSDGKTLPEYHQVFEDRIGFLPDLSILDLLFNEGPVSIRQF